MEFIEDHEYLLEKMEPIEAISHLLHSRIFEMQGYISIAKREAAKEDLDQYLCRLQEISARLITEFHVYLDYYHIGDKSGRIESF